MHALTKGAFGVALIAAVGGPPRLYDRDPALGRPHSLVEVDDVVGEPVAGTTLRCPPRTLAVQDLGDTWTCLALPAAGARLESRGRRLADLPPSPAFLRMTAPTESIPRLPDRPERYQEYQMPVDPVVAVGAPRATGAGERPRLGVRLVTDPNAAVVSVELEGEQDRPEVVLVGELYGITVVVKHKVVTGGGEPREYLVFYGNLARPGPNITSGSRLSPLAVIGFVGDGEEDLSAVYFEVRQPESALDRPAQHLSQLVSSSVAVDARNVLPLIAAP